MAVRMSGARDRPLLNWRPITADAIQFSRQASKSSKTKQKTSFSGLVRGVRKLFQRRKSSQQLASRDPIVDDNSAARHPEYPRPATPLPYIRKSVLAATTSTTPSPASSFDSDWVTSVESGVYDGVDSSSGSSGRRVRSMPVTFDCPPNGCLGPSVGGSRPVRRVNGVTHGGRAGHIVGDAIVHVEGRHTDETETSSDYYDDEPGLRSAIDAAGLVCQDMIARPSGEASGEYRVTPRDSDEPVCDESFWSESTDSCCEFVDDDETGADKHDRRRDFMVDYDFLTYTSSSCTNITTVDLRRLSMVSLASSDGVSSPTETADNSSLLDASDVDGLMIDSESLSETLLTSLLASDDDDDDLSESDDTVQSSGNSISYHADTESSLVYGQDESDLSNTVRSISPECGDDGSDSSSTVTDDREISVLAAGYEGDHRRQPSAEPHVATCSPDVSMLGISGRLHRQFHDDACIAIQMSVGIKTYVRPIDGQLLLSPDEHALLFRNIETLGYIVAARRRLLCDAAVRGKTVVTQSNGEVRSHQLNLDALSAQCRYLSRRWIDAYAVYESGLTQAFQMYRHLVETRPGFVEFADGRVGRCDTARFALLDLDQFLRIPVTLTHRRWFEDPVGDDDDLTTVSTTSRGLQPPTQGVRMNGTDALAKWCRYRNIFYKGLVMTAAGTWTGSQPAGRVTSAVLAVV